MITRFFQITFLSWLLAFSNAEGKRISQTKCEEYINDKTITTDIIYKILNAVPMEITSFNCSKSVDLIESGADAKRGEFRHYVLLGWETNTPEEYSFDCGGTLISDRYVLTAAHCSGRQNSQPTIVRFAELNWRTDSFDQFEIEAILRHPNYRLSASYNDIALVRLKEGIFLSQLVRPACLWDDVNLNVTSVIATGFGDTEVFNRQRFGTLRKVQLDIVNSSKCDELFRGNRKFKQGMTDQLLCIESRNDNRDTCQGDSGGAIQVLLSSKGCIYHVIGILSFGSICGESAPVVYTKVASYIDWIESVVWGP